MMCGSAVALLVVVCSMLGALHVTQGVLSCYDPSVNLQENCRLTDPGTCRPSNRNCGWGATMYNYECRDVDNMPFDRICRRDCYTECSDVYVPRCLNVPGNCFYWKYDTNCSATNGVGTAIIQYRCDPYFRVMTCRARCCCTRKHDGPGTGPGPCTDELLDWSHHRMLC